MGAPPRYGDHSTKRRLWSIVGLVVGAILVLAGLFLVGAYVFSAVIDRLGEPDQSLLFWALPVLFMGIMAAGAGALFVILGYLGLRRAN